MRLRIGKGFDLQIGSPPKPQARGHSQIPLRMTRSYDAAATTRHNENHWQFADGRDANSVISQSLPVLRNRARYEIRNNSYAKGITLTRANDTVGTGPTPQIQSDDFAIDREIEEKFIGWAQQCDVQGIKSLAGILRLAGCLQQDDSGEALIVMQNKREEKRSWSQVRPEVRLGLLVVEPDRLQSPMDGLIAGTILSDKMRNGIEVDEFGRPQFYNILKRHPGSNFNFGLIGNYDRVPASQVIHLYQQDRPGQARGVPRFTPALPLFALLRRFTLATVSAAEQAANLSGVLEQELTGTEDDHVELGDEVEITRGSLLTVTGKLAQLKAEHPAATYEMFKHEIINEIARCLSMPYNIAAGNSSGYNYASGRLDWQIYFRAIKTDRAWLEYKFLNRIFYAWFREASLTPRYFSRTFPPAFVNSLVPRWTWPGNEHVDPQKEAKAQVIRLNESETTTLATEYALQGKDWQVELRQRAKEREFKKELGLPINTKTNVKPEEPEEIEDEEEKEKEE